MTKNVLVLTPYVCQHGNKTIFQFVSNNKEMFRAVSQSKETLPNAVKQNGIFYNIKKDQKVELEPLVNGERYSHKNDDVILGEKVEESIAYNAMIIGNDRLLDHGVIIETPVLEEEG